MPCAASSKPPLNSNVGRQQTRGSALLRLRMQSERRRFVVVASTEVHAKVAVRPPGESVRVGLRHAHLRRQACIALVGCLQPKGLALGGWRLLCGSRLRPNRRPGLSAESCAGKVRRLIEGVRVLRFKGQSAKATLTPNPSFERTPYRRLRRRQGAAQLER
jgi:hypothetical protein